MQPNDLPASSPADTLPMIDLRIPGPWTSPEELVIALRKTGSRLVVADEGQSFVDSAAGLQYLFHVSDRDDELAEIFRGDGRTTAEEADVIAGHAVKVHVSGPGGSPEAAKALMQAASALLRAGGLGVMVDNSGATHSPADWLKLAGDTKPGGVYWAYVVVVATEDDVWSTGMHCLGHRDAEMPDHGAPRREIAGTFLHNFLGYVYQSGATIIDGDPLGDETGPMFRARHVPCTRFAPGTAFHNPYGLWRLEFIETDETT